MNGRLIVIEGLDGSGKATQADLLFTHLHDMLGDNVRKVSFPDYESPSSGPLKMYLNGEMGSSAGDVNAYAASTLFAVDRLASFRSDWGKLYNSGGTIIADRYTTSNAVHQCSKLPESQWDEFLEWLFDFEYRLLEIPAPDKVIYLRVDPDTSQQLLSKRYSNDESKKDIHERDQEYLRRSRIAADHCAKTLGWKVVECVRDGKLRSIEDIAAEIRSILLN